MQHENPKPFERGLPILAAAIAALLLSHPALAQDAKPAPKAPAKSTAKTTAKPANLMTRDELRACMDEQDRLKEGRSKIDQEQAALDKLKAQIESADAELRKRIAALDPADVGARKTLEEDGAKRDRDVEDYSTRLTALREQGKSFDSRRQAWVESCTKKNFDEMDEAAIIKERNQAARSGAKK